MQRFIYVKGGLVVNVVGYEDGVVPPLLSQNGESIVLDPTGTTNVGDPFDPKSAQSLLVIVALDPVILGELFRLSNIVATLQFKPTQTMPEYQAGLAQQYAPTPKVVG